MKTNHVENKANAIKWVNEVLTPALSEGDEYSINDLQTAAKALGYSEGLIEEYLSAPGGDDDLADEVSLAAKTFKPKSR